MNQFQEIVDRHKRESEERMQKMERDTQIYHEEYRHLIQEWRKYLWNFIFLLGGILTVFLSLVSSDLFSLVVDPKKFAGILKLFLLALGILVFSIVYSIFKDRELMWGRTWIKGFDFGDNEFEKYTFKYKFKKFLWILFPTLLPGMDGLTAQMKIDSEKRSGRKFTYFSDFKRRRTDFRILVYVTRLNDGVWNYLVVFGMLSALGIGLSFYAFYKLISLVA